MRRRYSDKDHYFGPFTLALVSSATTGIMLDSGEEDYPGCCLKLYVPWFTLLISLPQIIQPWRRKVYAHWDAATVKRLGGSMYLLKV